MNKRFEVTVQDIRGHCAYGYQPGDSFVWNGYDTPDGFCGGAYTVLFPLLVALGAGARFEFEDNPLSKTDMACPDKGNVIFTIRLCEGDG